MSAMEGLLKRAIEEGILSTSTREAIGRIREDCIVCIKECSTPRRFKLTIGSEDFRFIRSVQVDTMFLNVRPVVHMVFEATHYTAASFLRNHSTAEIWKTICRIWCLTFFGPPDFLVVDDGTAYVLDEMK